ncbi:MULTISPECIES: MarR family transcriptional regulator [unclassified Plantactinospora]|uniref:MarR family transcriptional regulator n=1 Tax=unclassified Plantactinospora TaxID=2631981 RepID=UPI000D160FBA|nr:MULTISPECIES: MarR family transcriptional regulator [unclassified Plantactinospora]AVT31391.1 MarR family transcriptional regulator [Plantactinospora sp. BC1]AVT38942.1 MarR family transcriptional regulator [Plantactinospora sp. BB1]
MGNRHDLIAQIMETQREMQHLFANDPANPLFTLHLTLPQLKALLVLSAHGSIAGQELSTAMGVSLATMTGMVDRLVAQGLVTRREDPHDRRVRRIELSGPGRDLVDRFVTAGAEKMRRILDRLSDDELRTVAHCSALLVKAIADDPEPPAGGCVPFGVG